MQIGQNQARVQDTHGGHVGLVHHLLRNLFLRQQPRPEPAAVPQVFGLQVVGARGMVYVRSDG